MRRSGLLAVTVVVLALAGVGDLVTVVSQHSARSPSVTTSPALGAIDVVVDGGSTGGTISLVVGPGTADRPVDVLDDPAYPPLLTTRQSIKGVYDHLSVDLPAGGWTAPIRRVDATELSRVVLSKEPVIAVVGTGALPDTVVGPGHDFAPVRDWLRAGGELIFAGDGLFYWAAVAGTTRFDLSNSAERVDWTGERTVLGADLVHNPDPLLDPQNTVLGAIRTPAAIALDTRYESARRGARLGPLASLGGWDVGWDTSSPDPRTSLAVIPVGAGRIILFGSGVLGLETQISGDVSKLLLSGTDQGPPLGSDTTAVGADQRKETLVPLPGSGSGIIRVLAYDRNGFAYFHRSQRVPR